MPDTRTAIRKRYQERVGLTDEDFALIHGGEDSYKGWLEDELFEREGVEGDRGELG